jgi:hypothetical protein
LHRWNLILKFESVDRAKDWPNSREHAPARKLRHATAQSNLVVVEGAWFAAQVIQWEVRPAAHSPSLVGLGLAQA